MIYSAAIPMICCEDPFFFFFRNAVTFSAATRNASNLSPLIDLNALGSIELRYRLSHSHEMAWKRFGDKSNLKFMQYDWCAQLTVATVVLTGGMHLYHEGLGSRGKFIASEKARSLNGRRAVLRDSKIQLSKVYRPIQPEDESGE
ncbi:hypothetical protein TMatcc_006235 [Talaromyces marneffei ATCC 18224]